MHDPVMMLVRLELREVFKIRMQRKHYLRPHVSNLYFAHHKPEVLHRSDPARTAISDKSSSFVVPFVEEVLLTT